MIDIHAHIMPFVDDGCASLEQAFAMLKKEIASGVDCVVLTPHFRGKYNASADKITREFNALVKLKDSAGFNVDLYLGQELFCDADLLSKLKNGKVLPLCGGKYVLLEFDYVEKTDISEFVYKFIGSGYKPIVAHVERYDYLTAEDVAEVKSLGGYIQVNADSVVGKSGRDKRKFVKRLFKEGLVDFVASDAHFFRKNYMSKAFKVVGRKYGKETANNVFVKNALDIIGR